MDVTAICERSGDWWAITVPEIEGGYSQTRRLNQVPAMVADLVNLATGTPVDQVHVTVEPRLGGEAATELQIAEALEAQSKALQAEAFACRGAAIRAYKHAGLSVRDIGTLTGISFQRVSQILAETADDRTFGIIMGEVVADIGRTLDLVTKAARDLADPTVHDVNPLRLGDGHDATASASTSGHCTASRAAACA